MSSGITAAIPAHPPRVRNGMLARALGSIAAQTLPPDEVSLAIDTGPALLFAAGNWQDALAELQGEEFSGERRGAWHTRQRALDAVQTEWTAFLDSDDRLYDTHLEIHAQWAEQEQADFVYAWFQIAPDGWSDPFPPEFFTEPWWPDLPRHTTTTVLVRTELAKRIGFTPPTPDATVGNEDWRFVLGCVEAGAKIVHIPGTRTWEWNRNPPGGFTEGMPIW